MRNFSVLRVMLFLMLGLVLAAGFSQPAKASEMDDDGIVTADEVIDDDLFLSADTVVMDGTINGNLFATGNQVTINGTVNGDLFIGGNSAMVTSTAVIAGNLFFGASTMELAGVVTGSVFGGSGTLNLSGSAEVGRNLYYGGYSLETASETKIGSDLFVGAYQAILKGEVVDDLKLSAAALELNGKVGGDASLDVEGPGTGGMPFMPFFNQPGYPAALQPGLRISDSATVGGTLTYTSPVDQSDTIKAQPEGGVVFQTPVPDEEPEGTGARSSIRTVPPFFKWLFDTLRKMVTLVILGVLSVWLLPKLLMQTVEQARSRTLPSAGYGFLAVIAGYAGAAVLAGVIISVGLLISAVTLGGLSRTVFGLGFSGLALALTLFTLLVTYGSKLVVAYLGGEWLMNKIAPQAKGKQYWSVILGVVIYVLLAAIPILGWLIALVATAVGLGAMWLVFRAWRASQQPVSAALEA